MACFHGNSLISPLKTSLHHPNRSLTSIHGINILCLSVWFSLWIIVGLHSKHVALEEMAVWDLPNARKFKSIDTVRISLLNPAILGSNLKLTSWPKLQNCEIQASSLDDIIFRSTLMFNFLTPSPALHTHWQTKPCFFLGVLLPSIKSLWPTKKVMIIESTYFHDLSCLQSHCVDVQYQLSWLQFQSNKTVSFKGI